MMLHSVCLMADDDGENNAVRSHVLSSNLSGTVREPPATIMSSLTVDNFRFSCFNQPIFLKATPSLARSHKNRHRTFGWVAETGLYRLDALYIAQPKVFPTPVLNLLVNLDLNKKDFDLLPVDVDLGTLYKANGCRLHHIKLKINMVNNPIYF